MNNNKEKVNGRVKKNNRGVKNRTTYRGNRVVGGNDGGAMEVDGSSSGGQEMAGVGASQRGEGSDEPESN